MVSETQHKIHNKKTSIPTVWYATETVTHIGHKTGDFLSNDCKISATVNQLKTKVKKWIPKNCPYRLCKNYIQCVGFV